MEFVALHMKTESILAVHKLKITLTGGKYYLCDCIISPDLSTFIMKPNAMYVLNFCRGEYENAMEVVSCKESRLVLILDSLVEDFLLPEFFVSCLYHVAAISYCLVHIK